MAEVDIVRSQHNRSDSIDIRLDAAGHVVREHLHLMQAEIARLRQELRHRDDERQDLINRFVASVATRVGPPTVAVSGTIAVNSFAPGRVPEATTITEEEYRQQLEELERRKRQRLEAEERALVLLRGKIGKQALDRLMNGGMYPVQSKLWKGVQYYVPKNPHERIRVMMDGTLVMESCLVSTRSDLPWADVMLQRILAIETDETIVVGTGVVHQRAPQRWLDRMRRWLGRRGRQREEPRYVVGA